MAALALRLGKRTDLENEKVTLDGDVLMGDFPSSIEFLTSAILYSH